jgi:hypothetical protein
MHIFVVAAGVFIVVIIVGLILFKAFRLTSGVLLLGAALIAVVYCFQQYLDVDLTSIIIDQRYLLCN